MTGDPELKPDPAPAPNAFQLALRTYVRAGYPILYVVTAEEERAVDLIAGALDGDLAKRKPYVWSVSRGLCGVDQKLIDPTTADPKRILPYLLGFMQRMRQRGRAFPGRSVNSACQIRAGSCWWAYPGAARA